MMLSHFSEIIHGWLGWCPQARCPGPDLQVHNDTAAESTQAQGAGIPALTIPGQRYRNQVLIWAVFFTMVSLPLVAIFLSADLTTQMLGLGMITGLGIFIFFGRRMWNSLIMLQKGATVKTGPKQYILTALIAGAIPTGGLLLLSALIFFIPLAGALAFPAFVTGFAYIPWYVLILILLWEKRTGCILMFDNATGTFSAAGCSEDLHH